MIARFDLPNKSNVKFGGYSLLLINEIGITSCNVIRDINYLIETRNLKLFKGFSINRKFAALGDDQGLLVFSDTKRNWYPTELLAQIFPTRVRIEDQGNLF